MIAALATLAALGLGEAALLHIAAWWNWRHNVAANYTHGERSTLIGSALILIGFVLWTGAISAVLGASIPPVLSLLALVADYAGAWIGAKSAWWLFARITGQEAGINGR